MSQGKEGCCGKRSRDPVGTESSTGSEAQTAVSIVVTVAQTRLILAAKGRPIFALRTRFPGPRTPLPGQIATMRHPRNLPCEYFSGLLTDERKTEAIGALAKLSELPGALLGIGGVGSRILVDEVALEHVVDQDGELAGGRRPPPAACRCGRPGVGRTPRGRSTCG